MVIRLSSYGRMRSICGSRFEYLTNGGFYKAQLGVNPRIGFSLNGQFNLRLTLSGLH